MLNMQKYIIIMVVGQFINWLRQAYADAFKEFLSTLGLFLPFMGQLILAMNTH